MHNRIFFWKTFGRERVNQSKNSWNLQKSTFIQLFLHSRSNWVRKSYFQSNIRFWECLITRWLETTSILVVIERIYRYHLKSNYLKIHKLLASFCSDFWNFQEIPNVLKQKMSLIDRVLLNLLTPKDVLI